MTDQKQIQIGKNLTLGNALPLVLIAGPCALENRDHVLKVADSLVTISNRLNIGRKGTLHLPHHDLNC